MTFKNSSSEEAKFSKNWKILEKNSLSRFIRELGNEYEVSVPIISKDVTSFEKLLVDDQAHVAEVVRLLQLPLSSTRNTTKPPKEVFFPQAETLFMYKVGKNAVEISAAPAVETKRVLLGVRPCDARSFVLLDRFFSSGDQQESYYLDKRETTTIVGIACNHPLRTCFCTSVGGSPSGNEGVDLLLHDLNDKYLIETVSEKGATLLQWFPWLKAANKVDLAKGEKLSRAAENAVKPIESIKGLSENLDSIFYDAIWEKIHQKCIGCGICTYLCPTCCCFDILDEGVNQGQRVRLWDSCMFPLFTLQGSGHNPRPSGKERMRQRIMHKFNYYVKNFGETFCVGCGRCVQECPVNLDIRAVIEELAAIKV